MRFHYLKLFFTLGLLLGKWAAYTQSGTLDTTFGTGGKSDFYLGLSSQWALDMEVLPDNKMLVAGQAFLPPQDKPKAFLARLTQEGKVDSTFGVNGLAPTYYEPLAWVDQTVIAVQPDGKIVLAYYLQNADSHLRGIVIRYTADGALDDTFGVDGQVFLPNDLSFFLYSLVVAPDGKILIGGGTSTAWYTSKSCTIYRLNPDGSMDNTFGNNGRSILQLSTFTETLQAMAIQPDGKIVGGGQTMSQTNASALMILRITDEGDLDPSFGGGDGYSLKNYGHTFHRVKEMKILPDGKILLAGEIFKNINSDYCLYKFSKEGFADTDFGDSGFKAFDFGTSFDEVLSVCFQPDGKTMLGGARPIGLGLARVLEDGSLDNTFGNDGTVFRNDYPLVFDSVFECTGIGLCSDHKIMLLVNYNPVYGAGGLQNKKTALVRLNNEIITSGSKDLPEPTTAIAVFPNPASSVFTLKYTIDKPGPVTIKLTDAACKPVKTLLSNAYRAADVYAEQYQFAPGSAQGLFTVSIESAGGVQVANIIKY